MWFCCFSFSLFFCLYLSICVQCWIRVEYVQCLVCSITRIQVDSFSLWVISNQKMCMCFSIEIVFLLIFVDCLKTKRLSYHNDANDFHLFVVAVSFHVLIICLFVFFVTLDLITNASCYDMAPFHHAKSHHLSTKMTMKKKTNSHIFTAIYFSSS